MRDEFVRTLMEIAKEDPNVILITGDLGFGVLTPFAQAFPRQFFNAGVAEQSMTGLAVGLALEGKTVFTYSIANFPTLRCLEQIRYDACYHGANVKIVAVGGGYAYGSAGTSHHATEDLAILRALPSMTVFAPGDPAESAGATRAVYETPGPCYLRLGCGGEPRVHPKGLSLTAGKAVRVAAGEAVAVFSAGGILSVALAAVNALRGQGVDAGLWSMPTVKPLDEECVRDAARRARLIVTVEEHSVLGGLGGAVAEVVAEMEAPRARLKRVGLPDQYTSTVGDQDYLRKECGLSAEAIADTVRKILRGN